MEARNKKIEDWFSMIRQGQVVLPRFQRHEAWKTLQIVGILENVLRNPPLPIGALLTLEVGSKELFLSRPLVGAPQPTGLPQLHVLDGQQRLTALWRSLNGNYEDYDFFVHLNPIPGEDDELDDEADAPAVQHCKRWDRKGIRQPVWADKPVDALARGLIPIPILCPGNEGEAKYQEWKATVREVHVIKDEVIERISGLRQQVAKYDIPFLSLGPSTGRETALDVFIKLNTSATPLKDFDIVVAQLESAIGESLHEKVDDLIKATPAIRAYGKTEDVILSIAALLMNRPPLKKTYLDPSFGSRFSDVWPRLKTGIQFGTDFLRNEGVLNEKCIPNDAALYLALALWADVPLNGGDVSGNARDLIRKVFWRGCYTDRYGKTSATRAFADYKVLRKHIDGDTSEKCELFDEKAYPLPELEHLEEAGWPGRKDRLPRAIFCTALRRGALDFADGSRMSANNFDDREYHHLYSYGYLEEARGDEYVNRALNCAAITWTTNRKVGSKAPSEYISERAEAASLGERVVKHRLQTQLIPYDELVGDDYDEFLEARAVLIERDMTQLCNGEEPN